MLTRTDDDLKQVIAMDAVQYQQYRTLQYLIAEEQNCPTVSQVDGVDFTDRAQQLGRPMLHTELERKLKKLVPRLVFKDSPNPKLRSIFIKQGEMLEYVTCHLRGINPEHSVMKKVVKEVLDPNFVASNNKQIDRPSDSDVEKVEDESSPFGYRLEFNPEMKRAGMKYVVQGHGEEERGWRTVLLRLIVQGLTTVDAVEREFGADQRAEWAFHTKKRVEAQPTW